MERYLKETKMLNYRAREIVALVHSRKWNDLDEYDKIGEIYRSFQSCDIRFIRNNAFQTQPFAAEVNFRPSMYDKRRGVLCHYFRHNAALKPFDHLCAVQSARNTD